MSATLVGDFENWTEQDRKNFEVWACSAEATRLFEEAAEESQREADAFLERISISHEELQRPFDI